MEKKELFKRAKKEWKAENKLIKPSVFIAKNLESNYFFVFRDNSTIIYMTSDHCNVTFVIPKKYCKLEKTDEGETYYLILDNSKKTSISCIGTDSNYEKFVLEKLIVDPQC